MEKTERDKEMAGASAINELDAIFHPLKPPYQNISTLFIEIGSFRRPSKLTSTSLVS